MSDRYKTRGTENKKKNELLEFSAISLFPLDLEMHVLSPGQTDRQVVESGRKLNLRRDLRWVAKWTRKFPRNYMQVAKKDILRQTILYFIGL